MTVYISKSAERGYVRRALRRYPVEHMEVLWGKRAPNGDVLVCGFVPINQKSTEEVAEYCSFEWYEDDDKVLNELEESLDDHMEHASDAGLIVIGSIHSHCYKDGDQFDDMQSYQDIKVGEHEGNLVNGICSIGVKGSRKVTKVGYWPTLHKHIIKYKQ